MTRYFTRKRLAGVLLILGTFFNPLGFDLLWAVVQRLTGSYWWTSFSFYLASICCFTLAWLLTRRAEKINKKKNYPS